MEKLLIVDQPGKKSENKLEQEMRTGNKIIKRII